MSCGKEIKYDRSSTVPSLIAKHKVLTMLREYFRAEIKKLTVDINHLDAAIRLFDPSTESHAIKEYVPSTARRREVSNGSTSTRCVKPQSLRDPA